MTAGGFWIWGGGRIYTRAGAHILRELEACSSDAQVLVHLRLLVGALVYWDEAVPEGLVVLVALEAGHVEAAQQLVVALGHLSFRVLDHFGTSQDGVDALFVQLLFLFLLNCLILLRKQ